MIYSDPRFMGSRDGWVENAALAQIEFSPLLLSSSHSSSHFYVIRTNNIDVCQFVAAYETHVNQQNSYSQNIDLPLYLIGTYRSVYLLAFDFVCLDLRIAL